MSNKSIVLSSDEIDKAIYTFDEEEKTKEETLKYLFSKYKQNKDEKAVLIKGASLNSLYSAGLYNNPSKKKDGKRMMDLIAMTKLIVSKPELDKWLYSDSKCLDAFEYIAGAQLNNGKEYSRRESFASKYCSWHNPELFPIMDDNSKVALLELINSKAFPYQDELPIKESINYSLFRKAVFELKRYLLDKFGVDYSIKDIDKYLWLAGKKEKES